jgi:hypothetical protein
MTVLLSDIRDTVSQELGVIFENETIILWCNNAQSDFGASINVPATSPLSVTPTQLTYALPTDLKVITRLWSQTDYTNGIDSPLQANYRIFNGNIIFQSYFRQADTINIDYYKLLKYFTAITDSIEIDDRYITIYTYYCQSMYYAKQKSIQGSSIRDIRIAMLSAQSIMGMYNSVKAQVIQQYLFRNEPSEVAERW